MQLYVNGQAGKIFVDDGGPRDGATAPVLFISSAAGNTSHWESALSHLRPGRRAIALDLRGHGRSDAPDRADFSVEALATDVEAVLDALALGRCVLVGHSLGGAVAAAAASRRPHQIAGLLLLDPASDGRMIPEDEAAGLMQALRSAYQETVEDYWASLLVPSDRKVKERLLADLRATPRATMIGVLEALLRFDPVTALGRYQGPRLSVITPLNDTPGAYHRLVPTLPVRRVEGTGHWLQLDAPAEVNAIIEAFATEAR
jgi:pimeloyl-ACP methyl ester carboxylesterase